MKFSWKFYNWDYETFISKETFNLANKNNLLYSTKNNGFKLKNILYSKYTKQKLTASLKKWKIYYHTFWDVKKENKIFVNETLIVDSFWSFIKNYSIPKELHKYIIEWLKKYYWNLFKENKQETKKLNNKINELNNKKDALLNLRLNWEISWETYMKKSNEFLDTEKDLKKNLENIKNADNTFLKELEELLELLSDLELYWKNTNYSKKLDIMKSIVFELYIDNKKELVIKENKIFEIIRNINNQSA